MKLTVFSTMLALAWGAFSGCASERTYTISFQKSDKTSASKPKKYAWRATEFEVVSDNYLRGEIKGKSTDKSLEKLKALIETLNIQMQVDYDITKSSPNVPSN